MVRGRGVQRVGQVARGRRAQQALDAARLDAADGGADVGGGDHQLADEALEVADERLLVREEPRHLDTLQVDGALQAAHEGLRPRGQLLEPLAQRPQRAVHLGPVRLRRLAECGQLAQQAGDIAQRRALQLAALGQRRLVGRQRALGRLAFRRELVEVARPVELLHRRHVGGVGVRLEVAPLAQLEQRRLDGLRLGRVRAPLRRVRAPVDRPGEGRRHLLRPQVKREARLGLDEDAHDGAIERGLVGGDVGEGAKAAGGVGHHLRGRVGQGGGPWQGRVASGGRPDSSGSGAPAARHTDFLATDCGHWAEALGSGRSCATPPVVPM